MKSRAKAEKGKTMKTLNEVNGAIKKTSKMMTKLAKRESDIDRALYTALKDWMEAHSIAVNEREMYGMPHAELIVQGACCYDELTVFVDLFGEED